MKVLQGRKKIILAVVPAALAILVLLVYLPDRTGPGVVDPGVDHDDSSDWVWRNPYTFTSVTIPGVWQQVNTESLSETVLALSHRTEKSLVYIDYEVTIDDLSLAEYVSAMQAANQAELGTDEFQAGLDDMGNEVYTAGGAKYFNDNMVVTNARIWSDKANHFWHVVSITDVEFRNLEYEALQLLGLLVDSTRGGN